MQMRFLGKTGLKVSDLCLGAMTFGREATEQTSVQMLNRFFEEGGNFIDTANVYSRGVSEEIVGRWLGSRKRDEVVMATKVRFGMSDGANDVGLSRKHILSSVEASLKRLRTDYIDLYQVHCWDRRTPLEETLSALDRLVQNGKVRYIGVSNYAAWQLQKSIDISRQMGWEPFVSLQPLYNLLDREIELDLVEVCLNEGVGIIPWSPLRGGWLSGKYKRGMDAPPEGTRVEAAEKSGWSESWTKYNTEHTWNVIDTVIAIASETNKSPAQVSLNWLLCKPGVTAPIIGARNMEQLENNLGASGWALSAEQVKRLDEASKKPLPYPYDMITRSQRN
jgi:aryl-alcohol dehydrogenase-like predicted oxidoreductase